MLTEKKIYYQDGSMQIARNHYLKTKSDMSPHHHDFLTISLLLNGKINESTTQGCTYQASIGQVSIKPPYITHSDAFIEDSSLLSIQIYDWQYYNLEFNEWTWISEYTLMPYFLAIIQSHNKKEIIHKIKEKIIAYLVYNKQVPLLPSWFLEVTNYIHQNYKKNIVVAELAHQVGKHPFHLGRLFKKIYGMDIKTYQQYLRIQKSLAQVSIKSHNFTEIAYQNGFSDQSHFCRTFKKLTHFTPRYVRHLIDV